eukprot:5258903-Amphidinium_carterae.6
MRMRAVPQFLALGDTNLPGGLLKVAGQKPLQVKGAWKSFDARNVHETSAFCGNRYTLSLYVPRKPELLSAAHLHELRAHDFPVEWFMNEYVWRQKVDCSDLCECMVQIFVGADDNVEELRGGIDETRTRTTGSLEEEVSIEVPTQAQQRAIHRAHCNLGHCSLQKLARAMKLAGVRAGVRLWVLKEFRCNECEQRGRVVRRPAAMTRS